MMLYDFIGPWLYWPLVAVAISGATTWKLNCVSVMYSEVWGQIKELKRLIKDGMHDGNN